MDTCNMNRAEFVLYRVQTSRVRLIVVSFKLTCEPNGKRLIHNVFIFNCYKRSIMALHLPFVITAIGKTKTTRVTVIITLTTHHR